MPTPDAIRQLDGPALCLLAYELGLAPEGAWVGWPSPGDVCVDRDLWRPQTDLDTADAVFRSLRARGWTTSCCWFADDRQHGDVFAATQGRAVGVHWPRDGPTEAMALLLCAVLAAASEGGPHDAQR